MFERSAQREESFTANPAAATTQVARSEAEGRGHPGRLCFAYFPSAGVPVAKQRKVGRPPGRDPASKNNHPAGSKKDQKLKRLRRPSDSIRRQRNYLGQQPHQPPSRSLHHQSPPLGRSPRSIPHRPANVVVLDGPAHLGASPIAQQGMPLRPILRSGDRKSTRLNSSHVRISYAVFCLKKKKTTSPHESLS